MRGKGVSQRVRRDTALERSSARLEAQPAAHVGGREAAAALREEQGTLAVPGWGEGGTRAVEVALEGSPGGLAGGYHARLASLPLRSHLLRVRVDRVHVQ